MQLVASGTPGPGLSFDPQGAADIVIAISCRFSGHPSRRHDRDPLEYHCLTIPSLRCTRTSESDTDSDFSKAFACRHSLFATAVSVELREHKATIPKEMAGRQPQRTGKNNQSILKGIGLFQATRRTRVKPRFVSPCLGGLFNKEDSEAGAPRA